MTWAEALVATILLGVTTVAVGLVAVRLAARLAPGDDEGLDRAVLACVVALAQLIGVATALAALGVLSRWSLPVAHAAVAVVVLRWWPAPSTPVSWRPAGSTAGALVAAVGLGCAALAAAIGLHGPSAEIDTMHYHVPNAAWFLRSGTLWKLGPSTPGYFTNTYPANGELVGTWLMSTTNDDRLVYLAPVLFGILCVLGTALLARELGGRPWAGALAGLAIVAAPISFHTQTHSLMIDLLVGGGVVGGLGLGLRARRVPTPGPALLAAGVALGLSAGAKQTALGPAVAAALAIVLLQPRARWRAAWYVAIAAAAFSAMWFVRLIVTTGNPLFPKTVAVGGHTLLRGGRGPLTPLETPLLAHLVAGRTGPLGEWAHQVARNYGPAIVIALVAIPAAVLLGRRGDRERWRALLAVSVVTAASFAFYFATPYTGGGRTGVAFLIASQLRYAFPFVLCGAALAAAALAPRVLAALATVALAFDAVQILRGPSFRPDVDPRAEDLALAVLVAAVVLVVARRSDLATAWTRVAARSTALVVPCAAVAVAVALVVLPGPTGGDPVGDVLRASGDPNGRVLLVGVKDVREMLGPTFENRVLTVGHGGPSNGDVVADPARFTALVEGADPAVIVVGPVHDTAPASWVPPSRWRHVGDAGRNRLYARDALSRLAAPSSRG